MERVHRSAATAAVVAMCLGMGIAACGGSSTTIPETTPGTGTDGGDGGGGSVDGGAGGYTLDNVCDQLAPVVCGVKKPCCEKTSTYDEAGCIAHEKASCEKDVADVRAGNATFHPERIDPCIAKVTDLFDQCTVTFDLLYRAAPALEECRTFEGTLAPGAACERDSQCQPSTDPKEFTSCDGDTKTCKRTRFLADGSACTLADDTQDFCDKGLYCDVSFASKPLAGTCKPATAEGKPCDATKVPFSLECGLGYYCNKDTARCTIAKGGGANCTTPDECASFKCEPSGGPGKTCTQLAPLVKPADCKGP